MNREELLSLLRQHMGKGSELGDKLVEEIIRQVNTGLPLAKAIKNALANTEFTGQYFEQLIDTICTAALLGYGIKIPSMQMKTTVRKYILSDYWAPDKMKLSKRLHGTSKEMRQAIIDTVAAAMRKGKTVRQMAMDLYDGYNSGKKVINGAELPQYLKRLVVAARSAAGGDPSITREFNLAVRKAEQQLKKMEQRDKPLKVAYQQLVDAAQKLNEKAMEKAAWVAVQEKARYYADRIAITESARAWSDMFYAKNYDDSLVIGFGWRLSTRHPRVDICDFHAKVDHYGMGAGNYPKDKMPPHPAHPFCTCNLIVLYKGEAEPGRFNPDAGAAWLKAQDAKNLRDMLGIDNLRNFEQDGKWQKRLRHWHGHKDPKPMKKLKQLLSNNGNVILIINERQIGKKIGKHAEDYGLDAGNPNDRAWLIAHINAIFTDYQEKRVGTFRGQGPGGARGDVLFYRKDNDIVVTSPDNQFVTILKDGIYNQSYLNANKEEGEK
ncbi:hypothetical protein [Sporomusa aerivorans]|uniref:hypothetical protein n=1 Tax=Sporomusa aerivorans TaxID=204936 RepID=UPI00352B0035